MRIKDILFEFMNEKGYKPLNKGQLAEIFDISKKDKKDFFKILNEMLDDGLIDIDSKNRYMISNSENKIEAVYQGNKKGFGFAVPKNKEIEDIFISRDDSQGALDGDEILVEITKEAEGGRRTEGVVVRITKRATKKIVGMFQASDRFGFVIPDDERISRDIFIAKKDINGAKNKQKVVVEITKWPEGDKKPEGKVIEIIGNVGAPGVDMLSIIKKFDLNESFPKKVEKEAENVPEEINMAEIERRVDLRNKTIFTIDGADAKDLDDAVSIEKLSNGRYKLGVHIADVTHYVREKSELDKEAYERATSVYLVDRVIPMLPRKLSNGVCSLNPYVDRLTMTVFMEIDEKGKVVDSEILETIINSKARLVYTDVSEILENEDEELMEKYKDLVPHFKMMAELAKILRNKREKRGAIDFNFAEAKVILDEKGRPTEIKKAERRTANKLIEEFMLVCNETVSEYMYWTETPFLYRVHEEPDSGRMTEFARFIKNFGYVLKGSEHEMHPKQLQQLVKKVEGEKEETVINTLMLRSLKKAKYSEDPLGHFGLAAEYYSHFTSPIRRYPDLQIHRIIKEFINGNLQKKRKKHYENILPEVADHTSQRERRAQDAERDSVDLKMTEFMSKRIGNVYDGIISSVTSFGMFVELENTVEGLIHISAIDGYYVYDQDNYCLIREDGSKSYRIGDRIKIIVVGTNKLKREIDFEIIENLDDYEEFAGE